MKKARGDWPERPISTVLLFLNYVRKFQQVHNRLSTRRAKTTKQTHAHTHTHTHTHTNAYREREREREYNNYLLVSPFGALSHILSVT